VDFEFNQGADMSITRTLLKSKQYLDLSKIDFDTAIDQLILDVTAQAIDYICSDDITVATDFDSATERALCKQIAFEFKRRNDIGVSSVTAPDGSITRQQDEEWLTEVRAVLDRKRIFHFGKGPNG
jgi:hypothetical protein